jgi:hypothetical protein
MLSIYLWKLIKEPAISNAGFRFLSQNINKRKINDCFYLRTNSPEEQAGRRLTSRFEEAFQSPAGTAAQVRPSRNGRKERPFYPTRSKATKRLSASLAESDGSGTEINSSIYQPNKKLKTASIAHRVCLQSVCIFF